jgi:hypothetical protein
MRIASPVPSRRASRTVATARTVAALLLPSTALFAAAPSAAAPPTWPSAWTVWTDDFEDGSATDVWEDFGRGRIRVDGAAARPPGNRGLAVDVSGREQGYLQRYHLTEWPHLEHPRDTYVRFAFHPGGATIPTGADVSILRLRDGDWNVMAGLRLRQTAGGYELALELPDGSTDATAVPIDDGWHTVVLGCRMHDWVGLWVDDEPPRIVTGVAHDADFVQVLILGKADGNWSGPTPSGTVRFDDVTLLFAAYPELWVDPVDGSDAAEGNTASAPLRTIGLAAILSSPGTTIRLAPGDYRESVVMPVDGTRERPIRVIASGGRGTTRMLGSEPAAAAVWTRLTDRSEIDLPAGVDPATAAIWRADLSAWGLSEPPRFVVIRSPTGGVERLTHAREPDFRVDADWRHHEFWWAAEGGTAPVTCDPAVERECDAPQRSDRMLVDFHDDAIPPGIEPGSLASLGDVTGAIVFVKDTVSGHYTYRRRVAETIAPGRVRLEALPEAYNEGCWFDSDPDNPGLGWHSKYYLEGLAKFLDTPGEWFFDAASGRMYVWTPDGRSPAEIGVEISIRSIGVDLSHRSYVELRDLDVHLFADRGIRVQNDGSRDDRSHGIVLAGLDVGWSTQGLHLAHGPQPGTAEGSQIRALTLRDSRIHDMESLAIFHWGGSGSDFVRPGITDLRIVGNEFDRIGFRDNEQGGVGLSFGRADHLWFERNHVHDVAHNGVQFSKAQTRGEHGFAVPPEEIYTGDILVRNNLFERCVQNGTDAGGLKFWGATADRSHTFRDVLVVGNVSRNNVGWAWVSEQRANWTYHGRGGMGYYVDFAGGIHFFRNIAYANGLAGFMASGSWIDQPVVLANNTIVGSPLGYTLGTRGAFAPANVGFNAVNTLFVNLERFAYSVGQTAVLRGSAVLDHDLFHRCGTEPWEYHTPGILAGHAVDGGYREYPTLDAVQALGHEPNGVAADPRFAGFDPGIADGRWQDFRLTGASTAAIDTGGELPESLAVLLARFGMTDGRFGTALDRGAIELDPDRPDAPFPIDAGPTDGRAPLRPPWDEDFGDPPVEPSGDAGCTCRTIPPSGAAAWTLLAVPFAASALRRRRRR